MLEAYRKAAAERAALGIPALPLTAQQTAELVELLKNPPAGEGEFLVELLAHRVPPGVDDASSPRLTDTAQRDYFVLRERIETITNQLNGLQEYVRSQCSY